VVVPQSPGEIVDFCVANRQLRFFDLVSTKAIEDHGNA
jgi:hypothetical protein